ncbi:MAG: PepSY domain-containing protein [Nitrospira sp.]
MVQRILNMLIVVSFVIVVGCQSSNPSTPPPSLPNDGPISSVPPSPEAACRERVKLQNSPLGIASRVAAIKASGTPVQAKEIKKNGHSVYQVVMQAASGKPRSVDIDPHMVNEEKLVGPLSPAQCKALEDQNGKEAFPIVTAIQLAEEQLNGTAQEAAFELRDGVYGYVVTVADAKGQQYRVLVDAHERKIIKTYEMR